MTLILSYIVAFVLSYFVIMGAVLLLAVPFKFLILKYHSFLPTSFFVVGFVGGAGWVWIYSVLSQHTFLKLTYFMIVVPSIYWIMFGIYRVETAKQGSSVQKLILDTTGDLEHYNQEADVRHEKMADRGRLTGFAVGMLLFLGKAPFFY